MHIVKIISKNEINIHFYITAAVLELIQQLVERIMKYAALLLQLIFKQSIYSVSLHKKNAFTLFGKNPKPP